MLQKAERERGSGVGKAGVGQRCRRELIILQSKRGFKYEVGAEGAFSGGNEFVIFIGGVLFKDSSTHNRQLHVHSQESPYQCELCLQAFRRCAVIKRHILIDADDRPYKTSLKVLNVHFYIIEIDVIEYGDCYKYNLIVKNDLCLPYGISIAICQSLK